VATFENLFKTCRPPAGRYSNNDLARLFRLLKEINTEVQDYEFEDVVDSVKAKSPDYPEADLKKEIAEKLLLRVGIYGDDGFYKVTEKEEELQKSNLPKRISKLVFENTSWYQVAANRTPLNTFKVILDFTPPPVWDLISSPTLETSNESSIQVLGDKSTWVEGSFNKIKSTLSPGWSFRTFVHLALYCTYGGALPCLT